MAFQFSVDISDRFGLYGVERVMGHALIANAGTNRQLDLRYRFVATLHQQLQIRLVVIGVKDDLLSHLNSVRVFEYKREFFLLT